MSSNKSSQQTTEKADKAQAPAPSTTPTEQVAAAAPSSESEKASAPATPPPAAPPPPAPGPSADELAAAIARAEAAEARAANAEMSLEDVRAELAGTQTTLRGAQESIGQMQKFMKGFGMEAALKSMPLSPSQVTEIVSHDHQASFEVLEEWKNGAQKMIKGRVLRAHHYPAFLDYVRAGLKVAFVPAK